MKWVANLKGNLLTFLPYTLTLISIYNMVQPVSSMPYMIHYDLIWEAEKCLRPSQNSYTVGNQQSDLIFANDNSANCLQTKKIFLVFVLDH